jgi:pimeloyl-ACP methyl ester carboxylesterase
MLIPNKAKQRLMIKLYAALLIIFGACLQSAVAQSIINPADTIVNFTASSKPTQPAYNTIGKWGRTPSLGWNTSEWKCYILNGCQFRIHFPKSYNPTAVDGKTYPMLVFFHGAGEAGPITDNELSLFHGGQPFQTAVDNGTYDGYVLVMQTVQYWGTAYYQAAAQIIDYMIANNKLDLARVSINGLSAGGQATWQFFQAYAPYCAAALPMSAIDLSYESSTIVNQMKYTPYWDFQGGQDGAPAPYTASQVIPYFYNAGANFTYTLFPTQGHDTWDSAWMEPNFFPFIAQANAANPWTLFGRTAFCPGNNINVTIGLCPGFAAYQWRFNGTVIPGDTTNSIVATQAGTYDARVKRGANWSAWSPQPVNIIVQTPTVTPPITVSGTHSIALPAADGSNSVTLALPTGDSLYTWQKIGSSTSLGNQPTLTVTAPGDYIASVIPKYGCSSIFSPSFEIINAAGPNPPSAASSLVANALGNTKVQLTWATQPNPTYAPTAFEVYRGLKTGGPYTFLGQTLPSTLQYTDSLLSPGVKYFYTIRAIDTAGAAPLSNEANATTASDKTPPTAPTNLAIQFTTANSISVAWTAATDNVGVDHYNIFVNGSLEDVTKSTSFTINGLTKGQWYSVYVVAADASGNLSNPSNQVDGGATTSGLTYNYYLIPTSTTVLPNYSTMTPTATGVSTNTNIGLYTGTTTTYFGYTWSGYITIPVSGTYTFATSSDDGSALWFNSLAPTGTVAATATVKNDGGHGVTTVSSSSMVLQAGTYPIFIEYFQGTGGYGMSVSWSCSALNGNTTLVPIPNQYFAGAPVTPPGTIPARPTLVTATAKSYKQVNVGWTDNSNNETGFEVYRATSAAGPFQIVTTTAPNATSFVDSTLSASTKYFYRVQAINTTGGSGFDSLSTGGITYKLYSGAFGSPMPKFDTLTPIATGVQSNTSLAAAGSLTSNFGLKFSGTITVPVTGTYQFSTTSDDASALYIGGYTAANEVVNNDYQQGATTRYGNITLTAGSYPIVVTYDQGGGGFSLVTSWRLPNTSTATAIPDSAFYNNASIATTFALPSAPVVPTLTGSAVSSSAIQLNWTDTSSSISSFTLNRSLNDSLHFNLYTTPAAGSSSLKDSTLYGHQTYYYQLSATGPGGASAKTPALGITTLDNAPVVAAIANQSARYSTTTTIKVSATDVDGDTLTFSGVNLPSFATITNTGNGTASLTFNPAQSNAGTYPGIGVSVSDNHGGVTTSTFTLTVNNNYPPVVTAVPAQSINTGVLTTIPLTATSPSGDNLTFTVTGAPNNYTLVAGPNGSDTLKLNPTFGSTGKYNVIVTVNDGNGGIVNDTFPVTVNFVAPTKQVYLRINDGDAVGAPWNNITGQVTTGIVDATGAATPWTFNFNTSWWGGAAIGPTTGNNSGVYPDAVLHDFWFFGDYGAPNTVAPTLTGLDTTKTYNITFYAGSVFNSVSNNGTTVYTVGTQSASLYVQNNTTNTVTLSNLKPDNTGTITINMSKQDANTPIGYINAMVVTQLFDDGTAPQSPYNLSAQMATSGSGVALTWSDSAYNETGYEIWRATNAAGPFTQILPDPAAKATAFTDSSALGFATYYYKVRALNAHGYSNYTNTVKIITPDKVPTLNAVPNVSINWGTSDTVTVTTSGATNNAVTLTASNLPSFATFTDNGNGTGRLIVAAPDSTTANYQNPTITMTDQADSIRTSTFAINVKNPLLSSVYVHFSDGVNLGGTPWNNITFYPEPGYNLQNMLNDAGANSGVSLTFSNGFQGNIAGGERPGNGSGIYPDPVMRSAEYEGGTQTDSILLAGLNPALQYNFVLFSSADWGVSGTTNFTLLGKSLSLAPAFNSSNVVQFSNLNPRANGTVSLGVTKSSTSQYSFLNDLVIEGFDSTKLSLLGPGNLHVTNTLRNSISLAWTDQSWNETGFEIWRTTDSTGIYAKVGTVAANVTTYTDAGLTSNQTYYYIVRAVKGTTYSTYSNAVASTTSSYAIYLQFNIPNTNIAGLPWNSLNQEPVNGTSWSNFTDDQGSPTSTGMTMSGLWAGMSNLGNVTGNNSGAVPDVVIADCYVLFAGQSGGFVINSLNINQTYDVTFFGSLNFQTDANAAYVVNGKTVILNGSLNSNKTVTAYGVKPDQNGNITISMSPAAASTEDAVINALILRAYTADANPIPAPPVAKSIVQNTLKTGTVSADESQAPTLSSNADTVISAYPNPFSSAFTLQVPAQASGDKALVEIYSVSGNLVYGNLFKNLNAGPNYLSIQPSQGSSLETGVYILKVVMNDGKEESKTIKLIKQ